MDPGEERLLIALEYNVDQLNFLFIGALLGAASLAMIVTRALPLWVGIVGACGGALLLTSNIGVLDAYPTGPIGNISNIGVIGQFLFVGWLIAVSVILIRRSISTPVASRATKPDVVPG